jgi:hypothetical protein
MRKARIGRVFAVVTAVGAVTGAALIGTGSAASGPNSRFSTAPNRAGSPSRVVGGSFSLNPNGTAGPNRPVIFKTGAQSETTIAVDPTNPNHLYGASNDLVDTATVYESTDAGIHWAVSQRFEPGNFCYDPWLTFNKTGDAFFAYECSDQRIAYKKVGQATWTTMKLNNAGGFPDRDMVVADNTSTSPFFGSVYIGYDDNGSSNAAHLMISRNGFGTWAQSPKISDGANLTIGVNAAVAPNGNVFATWEDFNAKKIRMDVSTNGGATWGTDKLVHNYRINTTTFFISIPPQPQRGVLPMPMTAVAPAGTPNAGRLYVAYFDSPAGGGSGTDCIVQYSDNNGTTWSAEKKVNDDNIHAYNFHCAIAVDQTGRVGVSFYSTRNDATNKRTIQYISFSTDGGNTWDVDTRVASSPSDESGNGDPNDYGDYQGLSASQTGIFHPVWTDSRLHTKSEDVVTSAVTP